MDDHSVDDDEAEEASPSSLHKTQSMRNKRLKRDPQLGKVQDALEHIVVAGAKINRDEWRKRRFEDSVKTGGDTTSSAKGRRKRPRPPTTDTSTYHHAEDLRIYGNRDAVPPENRKEQEQQYHQWNREHGDSVPPIHFRIARLSGEYPSEDQLRSLQSHCAVNEAHVPRDLIEHCWERAVHIASNALVAPVTTTTITNPTTSNVDSESSLVIHFDASTPLSREECLQRCKSLGIDLDDSECTSSTKNESHNPSCPRCTRSFATKAALEHHYYGETDTLGCCRPLVRPKHLDLIRTLLQDHVRSQTDRLLEIVLSSSQTNATLHNNNGNDDDDDDIDTNNDDNTSTTEDNENDGSDTASKKEPAPQCLDWKEIQSSLKRAVADSVPLSTTIVARHPVQESLRMDTGSKGSLVLNPMIVDAVHRRLIDRYAHVPR